MRVLIVDDYKTMLRLLQTYLRRIGKYEVEEAIDGLDALERLRARTFDLVISDWHMQPMTGFELLRRVRADPVFAAIPFIMVTAECAPNQVAAAKMAGVSAYIVKPFNAETLNGKIRAACANV